VFGPFAASAFKRSLSGKRRSLVSIWVNGPAWKIGMTTRALLVAASAIAAAMTAGEANALVPLSMEDSVDPTVLGAASPDALLAPQAFERRPDDQYVPTARITNRRAHLQCVPFARREAGLDIHGDANTWWTQAKDHFARAERPEEGSVIVLRGYAGPNRGH